jgi:hypothetical protein
MVPPDLHQETRLPNAWRIRPRLESTMLTLACRVPRAVGPQSLTGAIATASPELVSPNVRAMLRHLVTSASGAARTCRNA